jgi:hypothetical protein
MLAGFTICVTAPTDNAEVSLQEIFQVAINDDTRAKEAVRITALVADDAKIQVIGKISATEIGWLSLEPGEVRSIRGPIPLQSSPAEQVSDQVVSAREEKLS